MLEHNLTTWAESPSLACSDCHAWSAVLIDEMAINIAELTLGAPKFKEIWLEPRPEFWERMSVSFTISKGVVCHETREELWIF